MFCSIAECFSFLVCTKWSNPVIHRNSREASSSSSTTIRYLDWNSGLVVSTDENLLQGRICSVQDIGGHFMKVPLIVFQILLCMHLEVYDTELCAWSALGIFFGVLSCFPFQGTPASAAYIPLPVLFSPLFLLQGAGVLLSGSKLAEKLVLLLRSGAGGGIYFRFSSRVHDCFGFLHHGSR